MPEGHGLLLFVAAGLLLNLTPGPDVLCIIGRALRGGLRSGCFAALGVFTGCFVHVVAAAVGVGALLAHSAQAFMVLKWIGAAYLVWVGTRMLLARGSSFPETALDPGQAAPHEAGAAGRAFVAGFWTNALNPKVALFFLAFVPQFIDPHAPGKTLVFLLLGTLFNLNALAVNAGWAALAAAAHRRLGAAGRWMRRIERGAGVLFILFGLRLAVADVPASPPGAD